MDNSGIIYLVQHCATSNDAANYPVMLGQRYQNTIPLSTDGTEQAKALATYFAGKGVETIYTSPLARAVQTAMVINKEVEGSVIFCESLTDVDAGDWEGMTLDEIARDENSALAAHVRDPATYGYPGGETLGDVARRAFGILEAVAARHRNQRVVIITHKDVNLAVLPHLMGVPMTRAREIDQDPGGVNVIRVFRGVMELQAVNFTRNFELVEEEQCDVPSAIPVVSE